MSSNMLSRKLTDLLGNAIEDAGEETFLLFSQTIPSQNLGFLDGNNRSIEVDVGGQTFYLNQSPGLLKSNRQTGTTGAVIWKITPLVAEWLFSTPEVLKACNALHSQAVVVEVGCGITGLIGMVVAPNVATYILSDQDYVMKVLQQNIDDNIQKSKVTSKGRKNGVPQSRRLPKIMTLDWETDAISNLVTAMNDRSRADLVIVCDCVYNDYLIQPLVETLKDICLLGSGSDHPTTVLVAQQLRSDAVFEAFLEAMMAIFVVWRIGDQHLSLALRDGTGYAVHLAQLKIS